MQFIPVDRPAGHFQQAPTPAQLEAMCRAAFGHSVQIHQIRELSSGLFNNTFVVDLADSRTVVLRVAPAPGAHVYPNERWLMRREYSVQPYLVPACPAVPRTLFADFSHTVVDRDYVFQAFIEGEVWGFVKDQLSPDENNAVRRQLGRIARQINAVRGDRFGSPYPDPGFSRWSDALLHLLSAMARELVAQGKDATGAYELVQWIERHRPLFDAITEPRLLHGDLWPQNVIISREGSGLEIVGLIDSERALWGDPEFEWIYCLGNQQPAYWEGYGERDTSEGAPLRAVAYRGIWLVLVIMEQQRFNSDASWAVKSMAEVLATLRMTPNMEA